MINILLKKKRKVAKKNFFDYPAKEQKKIIVKAAKEADKEQDELVKRYNRAFSSS